MYGESDIREVVVRVLLYIGFGAGHHGGFACSTKTTFDGQDLEALYQHV